MVTINIKSKHLYLISAIMIFLVGVGLVLGGWADTTHTVWHDSDNIKVNIDGIDYSLQEGINNKNLGITCSWEDMVMTPQKPSGANCGTGNSIAYITIEDADADGVTGFCKYSRAGDLTTMVYGNLELINLEYDSEFIVRCSSNIFTSSIATSGACGVATWGTAKYMKCS